MYLVAVYDEGTGIPAAVGHSGSPLFLLLFGTLNVSRLRFWREGTFFPLAVIDL
jgi:hypothetical protein